MRSLLPKILQLTERGVTISFEPARNGVLLRAEHQGLERGVTRLVPAVHVTQALIPDTEIDLFLKRCDDSIWEDPDG